MGEFSVLVIDDNDGDRKLIRRLLARSGLADTAIEAESASAALALTGLEPDAVFLDYLLPGETGLSALPEVRRRWPAAAIFMMTGQGDENVAKTAILNGAADYITKNVINQSALQRMLRNGVEAARMKWRIEQQRQDLATFSEVLVHDLKAPIRAVAFLAEQIAEDIAAGDAEEVGEGLKLLRKSTSRMIDMINALHAHVRLDRHEEFEDADVRDLVDGALTALDLEVAGSGATVEVRIEPGLQAIHCGGPLVSQVLQNLIGNAIKYAGGRTPRIEVRVARLSDEVRFEVADNGMGIAAEHLRSVFEPFKRAPGLGEIQGTGLGLATCRKLVLRHNGRIWCESEPGAGTTMIFCLPQANRMPLSLSA